MLQIRCSHSKALPIETCCFCNCVAPESLADICFEYILNHLESICEYESLTGNLKLRSGVTLPVEICERLLNARLNSSSRVNPSFINIFRDRQATRLKRVKLHNIDIQDRDLKILLSHGLVELEISHIPALSYESLCNIAQSSVNLMSLTISDCPNVTQTPTLQLNSMTWDYNSYRYHILNSLNMRKLCLRNFERIHTSFYETYLKPLDGLTHLDLSNSKELANLSYIQHLTNLTSLILYNVGKIEMAVPAICTLKNLRHLDISQSRDDRGKYEKPNRLLATIVKSLPKLTSLDISGTNLAGRGVAEFTNESQAPFACDIPGLSSRTNNPFQFLGLYETQHDACLRHDIPAKLVAGNANEEQVLIAALAYLDRSDMLQKVLSELFHLFRFESCEYVGQALNIVLEAMSRHLKERHIQISGSATLFYIVKGAGKELHDVVKVKRRIIMTLLNGMSTYRYDETMLRNGCLTLCQFKIPADVLFDYERLVDILLYSVYDMQEESFVQRIGIYLLNSLACQVDGQQKVKLGELGAINKMIWLISDRLERGRCDDVLEVAWSTMWNVTDETPPNCRKFLDNKGMELFLKCLEKFADKEELLRNMMGLLGNVAEVRDLRHYLMTPEYISVFTNLLDSKSDGIEVSYNAAGVISHIASDGPEVWTVEKPSRQYVLKKMVAAIDRWDLNSSRNINYRSFEPILYLVRVYDTPECQRWAVWALANLTRVYPDKYCALVESEGGLLLLQELIDHPSPPARVKHLAMTVIQNCKQFKEQDYIDADVHLDG